MIRLERRPAPSRAWSAAAPLLAVALTTVAGGIMFALLGVDPLAALLFVPYLVWVVTAAALNLRILTLNPALRTGSRLERVLARAGAFGPSRRGDAGEATRPGRAAQRRG